MKTTEFKIAVIALMGWVFSAASLSQSIASAGNISAMETSAERKQLEDLWKAVIARSPNLQSLVKNLNGDHELLLSTVLCNAEESIAGQLLGMTPRGTIVGTFCLADPYIEPALPKSVEHGEKAQVGEENEKLPQAESQQAMLTVLRQQARKLVGCYREYVLNLRALANADGKVNCKVKPPEENEASAPQTDFEDEATRVQQEIDRLVDNLKRSRSGLTELVGAGAVRSLDEKINGTDSLRQVDQYRHIRKFDEQFVDPAHHAAGTG